MKNVKIYSSPTCGYCVKVKQYFADKNVEYEDINVAAEPDKAKEMVDKSGQMGVPVLDIEGEIIVGFDKDKINAALGIGD